jgi:hypothetical protein
MRGKVNAPSSEDFTETVANALRGCFSRAPLQSGRGTPCRRAVYEDDAGRERNGASDWNFSS